MRFWWHRDGLTGHVGIPLCREPFQIRFVPGPRLLLTSEERVGLVQDKCVGAPLPPGHVGDGQFGGVDPGVDVLPALFGERPFEGAPALVFEEFAESAAQPACAAARGQFDRPVAGRTLRPGEPGAEPRRAVGGQVTEPAPPRAPPRDSSAAARSAGISSAVTASPCFLTYPKTVSRVLAAPIAAAAVSTEASGPARSRSFSSRRLGDDASPVPMSLAVHSHARSTSCCAATAPAVPEACSRAHRPGNRSAIHRGGSVRRRSTPDGLRRATFAPVPQSTADLICRRFSRTSPRSRGPDRRCETGAAASLRSVRPRRRPLPAAPGQRSSRPCPCPV